MKTIGLLAISNTFMTFAWYGHLKYKETVLWKVILVSWAIAFFEYCFQVPSNRFGHGIFMAAQLNVIQEVITLVVFGVFSLFYLKEGLKWVPSLRSCSSWRQFTLRFVKREKELCRVSGIPYLRT